MKVQATVKIKLTEEEFEIINKACEILGRFEMNESEDVLSLVQRKYMESVDLVNHDYALSTTIDFLDMLLTDYVSPNMK